MAFESGTAQNMADFIDKLQTFLTAHPDLVANNQAWTKLHDVTVAANGTAAEARGIAFKAPGLAASDEIFIGMNSWSNTAADWYNLRLYGGTAFDAALITETNGSIISGFASPSPAVQILLWNAPMPYWFFASGRRVWIVAKVSSNYESGGAGFILPPCPPSYYPYPLMVTGSYAGNSAVRWTTTEDRHRGISSPYLFTCYLRDAGGNWQQIGSNSGNNSNSALLWPLGSYFYGGSSYGYGSILALRDTFGTFPLLPLTVCNDTTQFGELDGAFYVPSQNSGAGDVITVEGVDYIVFQTAHRSGNPWLFALRED